MKFRIEAVRYCAALSLFFSIVENSIPHPLPFLRFGFANISLLMASRVLGFIEFGSLCLFKMLIQLLFSGNFLTPVALVSISFNITAFFVMFILRTLGRSLSFAGVSCLSSFVANSVQSLILSLVLLSKSSWPVAVIIIVSGLFFSFLTGVVANCLNGAFLSSVFQSHEMSEEISIVRFKFRLRNLLKIFFVSLAVFIFNLLSYKGRILFTLLSIKVTSAALVSASVRSLIVIICYLLGIFIRRFVRTDYFLLAEALRLSSLFADRFSEGKGEPFMKRLESAIRF